MSFELTPFETMLIDEQLKGGHLCDVFENEK
jgi:hypothetical protein